ncbi:high affinity copper uptake protein 1 [Galendromus occidentalis]|uniref:Copper transport protein n=1 Tax=Galendromus occidentalis TaxID=34638 RepID=A0AAJ6VY02_9ACAR|nr:high affinity copper uptake protein 1 [Galendromus occidentalis]
MSSHSHHSMAHEAMGESPKPHSVSAKPMPMMHVSFYFGTSGTFLFDWWNIEGAWGMLGSCGVVFFMALFYEYLKFLRARLLIKSQQIRYSSIRTSNGVNGETSAPATPETESTVKITSTSHLSQTAIYVVQLTLGYLLMLLFMYFNVWICLAVILGASTGYFLFGWQANPSQITAGDHCTA